MGTWGPGTFDDDIACDWIEDLHDSDPFAFFVHCLDLSGQQNLDHLACIGVVCTAEVLLGLIAGPRDGLPELVRQWINDHHQLCVESLVPIAISGLGQVVLPESAMHQLWEDNAEAYDGWMSRISDLRKRLEKTMARKS